MRGPARRLARRLYLSDATRRLWQRLQLALWARRGRSGTPPSRFKQRLVAEYAERFSAEILVETGTHLGDMVFATRKLFRTIYSIELDPRLYRRARSRFERYGHVHIVHGDSWEMLRTVLPKIDRKALFWLDAHHMVGGVRGVSPAPVGKELDDILASGLEDYVLLLDDARLFTGRGYPTVEEVRHRILERHPAWVFEVESDVIRCHRPAWPTGQDASRSSRIATATAGRRSRPTG